MMMTSIVPYSMIFNGINSGIIGTISTMTIKTCGSMISVHNKSYKEVIERIKNLDIEMKVETMMILINDLSKHNYDGYTESGRAYDPVDFCINEIEKIIKAINENLKDIESVITNHRSKWFNRWRESYIEEKYKIIENNVKIMDIRIDTLVKVSQIIASKAMINVSKNLFAKQIQ
jgi:hypothetical protein